MALKLKFQSKELNLNKTQKVYKQTYYGKENEIDDFISGLTLGTFTAGKGFLSSITKKQDQIFWNAELEYTTDFSDGSFSNTAETIVGKKSATLSVRNIQMPLEKLPNYKAKWNYYLIGLDAGGVVPAFWDEATSTKLTGENKKKYNWIKNLSEMPTEPNSEGKYWEELESPTKAGTDFYDYAVFVVQQSAKYQNATAAGNAIAKNINKIVSPSNTFGISGGNWKLDESSVSYDGKNWIATSVYTHSGDANGWDVDLYGNNQNNA